MSLSPMLLLEKHRVLPLVSSHHDKQHGETNYTVLGNLPSSLDKVASPAALPRMNIGDRLAVLDTGAYCVSLNNTFAGPRPAVAFMENGRHRLARIRETFADLVGHDTDMKEGSP